MNELKHAKLEGTKKKERERERERWYCLIYEKDTKSYYLPVLSSATL